jgi:hypothetical protein
VLDLDRLTSNVQILISEVQELRCRNDKQNLEIQELRCRHDKQNLEIQELRCRHDKQNLMLINHHSRIQDLRLQIHHEQRHSAVTVQELELVIRELRRSQGRDALPIRRPRGEQMVEAPDWLSAEQQGSLEEKHAEHLELFLPRQHVPAPPTDDEDEEEIL